jgi:hypothetical protein
VFGDEPPDHLAAPSALAGWLRGVRWLLVALLCGFNPIKI